MSKILFLVNHDVVIYNFRLELVERLLKEGHEVIISSPYGEKIEILKNIGCQYRNIDISRHGMNPVKEIKLLYEYNKVIKEEKPDVVLAYTIKPNIYGSIACAMNKIPCINNITGLGTAVENGGMLQKMTVMLYKVAFRKVKKIFFQNEENLLFFVEKNIANSDKYQLIPGSGVNLERFCLMEYPMEKEKIEFAFISRIMKEKGIDQYLDAAKYIKKKYPNTIFHVCGFCEQDYEEKLKKMSEEGVIIYHGMVQNVKSILEKIHCTVHPTYYPEGISNVLLESAACGRPIITTDRSGCREVIENEKNGFICKQKDSEDIIKQIERFISLSWEEKKNMGIKGREKVEREFDRNIVIDAYLTEIADCEKNI